jgi:streptomycin 3"-adenylyltransferase
VKIAISYNNQNSHFWIMSEIERNVGFRNAPAEVKGMVRSLKDGLQTTLNGKLIGLYLYGSLAYDCFNPEISDIDFVVVLSDLLTPEEEQITSHLHKHLGSEPNYGRRIEGTYMTEEQVKSDAHAPGFLYCVDGKTFVRAKEGQREPDFPMHRQHLYESGLKIVGCEPQKLFHPVPWKILKRSLQQEILFIKEQFKIRPIYAVLNLCRVVRAFETQGLSSKKQAGEWGLQYLPLEFQETIQMAMKGYTQKISQRQKQLLIENLPLFYGYCVERIANR